MARLANTETIDYERISGVPVVTNIVLFAVQSWVEWELLWEQSFGYLLALATTVMAMREFGRYVKVVKGISPPVFLVMTVGYSLGVLFNYKKKEFLLINSLWLLPQICKNIWMGNKSKFHPRLYTVFLFNQIYSLYILGCPSNLFQLTPKYWSFLLLLFLLCLQLLILYFQSLHGGRFLLPKSLIPNYH